MNQYIDAASEKDRTGSKQLKGFRFIYHTFYLNNNV